MDNQTEKLDFVDRLRTQKKSSGWLLVITGLFFATLSVVFAFENSRSLITATILAPCGLIITWFIIRRGKISHYTKKEMDSNAKNVESIGFILGLCGYLIGTNLTDSLKLPVTVFLSIFLMWYGSLIIKHGQ